MIPSRKEREVTPKWQDVSFISTSPSGRSLFAMKSHAIIAKFTTVKDGETAEKQKNLPAIGGMTIQKDG